MQSKYIFSDISMFRGYKLTRKIILSICFFLIFKISGMAQMPTDGLMMGEGKICNVLSYSYDGWKSYWEGTFKRENYNLGKVSTQSIMYMGAFGVTKNLNLMVGIPYVWTKASAGTLLGLSGIQDLSLDAKYRVLKTTALNGTFSAFGVIGFSTPMSNYAPDYLPLSLGLHSTTGSLRGVLHYQTKAGFFATVQGGYILRSNTTIDRPAYYTDAQYNTKDVGVPDVFDFTSRLGYESPKLLAQLYLNRFSSLSGNDIRRNDMPFPANAMKATRVGVMGLYKTDVIRGLGITASASYTLAGRNVGQSTSISTGLTYIISVWKPKTK